MTQTTVTTPSLEIPIFPLHTVLFPGGPLPLRIFETRYLDMVSDCLKRNRGFGVCLIREGKEVGDCALPYEVGTLARIADWHTRHDGLLGITVHGEQRFRIINSTTTGQQLHVAHVELLAEEPMLELPARFLFLVDIVKQLIAEVGHYYVDMPTRYGDACWLSFRLAELLPLPMTQKLYLLQLDDSIERLERLCAVLKGMDANSL